MENASFAASRLSQFPLPTEGFAPWLCSAAASRLDSRGRLSPHESQSYFILTFRRARLKPCPSKLHVVSFYSTCFAARDRGCIDTHFSQRQREVGHPSFCRITNGHATTRLKAWPFKLRISESRSFPPCHLVSASH